MFSFFKKKEPAISDTLSCIGADMHNHLLPGIDDGSPDVDTSLILLESLMQLGYHTVYCTPHVLGEVHPNTPTSIEDAYRKLKTATDEKGWTSLKGFSAEYMTDYDFEAILEKNDLVELPGKRILIEMSFAFESPNIREMIFQLQTKGYEPILAHPERYPFYFDRFDKYESFVDAGADLQINILSLAGYYGKPSQKVAEKLLDEQLVTWVGTDLHHDRHLASLQKLAADKNIIKRLERIKLLKNRSL